MPRPISFTHMGIAFKAFPEAGCFFGVTHDPLELWNITMLVDGRPNLFDGEPDVGETEYLGEYPEGGRPLLQSISEEFGVTFAPGRFSIARGAVETATCPFHGTEHAAGAPCPICVAEERD